MLVRRGRAFLRRRIIDLCYNGRIALYERSYCTEPLPWIMGYHQNENDYNYDMSPYDHGLILIFFFYL